MTTLDDVNAADRRAVPADEPGQPGALPPVDTRGLPPGPRWPVLAQTAALLRFRHRFHPYLRRKYGDVFTVRLAPGGRPLVIFTRPEHAKEIFAGDPEVFHAGKANGILGPIMGEHSLLLQDGGRAQAGPQAADAGVQRPRAARVRVPGHRGREGRGRDLAPR